MLGGGVDAATLVAALGAGPPPPDCRWGRRPVMIAALMALASKATAALESCWRWNGTKDFGPLRA